MNTSFHLRRLQPGEAGLYQALRLEGLVRHPELFRVAYSNEVMVSLSQVAEKLRNSYSVGAFQGEELLGIGSIAAFQGEKLAHKAILGGMYVRREAGGLGLGEAIVSNLLQHAESRFDSVQLTAAAGNRRAQSLYERCGFSVYGVEPRSIKAGNQLTDEVLMWWRPPAVSNDL